MPVISQAFSSSPVCCDIGELCHGEGDDGADADEDDSTRFKMSKLHSSHVGFVIRCILTMPSCDNDGLDANSLYFTSNLFYKLLLYFYKYRQSNYINIYINKYICICL